MKVAVYLLLAVSLPGQVTYDRLLDATKEPGNWITYSGAYSGWRYSPLEQIQRDNVSKLKVKWVYQMPTTHTVETTPLVADGVMYVSEPPSNVVALDIATGRPYWRYRRELPNKINVCCGQVNRGVALLGDRVFVGTVDAHLVALDAKTGAVLWDVPVADYRTGHSVTVAPLAVKGMIVCGIAGGEYGVRGFLDAYDPETGKRRWRFWTVPAPGEPGSETWSGQAWKTGGAPTWVTGSFDPAQNLIVWGTGNPAPDWNGDVRPGDNLYTDSAIALDADTGKLKWHYQFVPHDVHDWDAVQVPVLVDDEWEGKPRKLVYWAHRGGFFYVLDRETGKPLLGKPFATQTWSKGLDDKGRPILVPGTDPTPEGTYLWPGVQGATNWYSPSYNPLTKLFYLAVWENRGVYRKGEQEYTPGNRYIGSVPLIDLPDDPGTGAIRALNPKTGDRVWEYKLHTKPWAGVLSTAGKLVFGGSDEGYFFALDADTGKELWRQNTGGIIRAGPISYLTGGKQNVAIAAGSSIFAFELAAAQSSATATASPAGKVVAGGAIRSGHMLFLSGIGGWYPDRRPKPGDVREQTGDALTMMKAALEKAGSSMDNVLKVQVALVDPEHNWTPMNEVYNTFFKEPRPARSYFGATGFRNAGQLLQIDCIAYVE